MHIYISYKYGVILISKYYEQHLFRKIMTDKKFKNSINIYRFYILTSNVLCNIIFIISFALMPKKKSLPSCKQVRNVCVVCAVL